MHAQKIKLCGNPFHHAFVALRSSEDRDQAMKALQGFKWKGNTLSVTHAKPSADPFFQAKKRDLDQEGGQHGAKRAKLNDAADDLTDEQLAEMAIEKSAPLSKLPYEEQLAKKEKEIADFLKELDKDVKKILADNPLQQDHKEKFTLTLEQLREYFGKTRRDGIRYCKLESIVPSPDIDGYRNKCEFSIGTDKTVGFRIGMYKHGCVRVVNVDQSPIVSQKMKDVTRAFDTYLKEHTKLAVLDLTTKEGHWKQLTVRTSRNGQLMLVPAMEPGALSEDEINAEKTRLKEYFEKTQNGQNVDCLYIQIYVKRVQDKRIEDRFDHIFGPSDIVEQIEVSNSKLKFNVGPASFFQTNAAAAEKLYQALCDLADVNENTILLDICCGE